MLRTLRSTLSLTLALAFSAIGVPALAQEITLKVHHFWPPTAMGPTTILGPWCEKIAKESGGRMRCQIFPSMQLGGTPPQLVDQVRDGVVDIIWTLPGYTAGRFPLMEVFELPFMTNSAESASRAAWDYYAHFAPMEFPGIKVLAVHVHDEGYVHTVRVPIRTLADFKGLKLRAPTRQTTRMLAALGATPVAMPLPALPDALSKGVIDGFLLPWEAVPPIKAHELVKFHSETDPQARSLYSAVFLLAMNQARYDALPADLRRIIDSNSGAELCAAIGKAWDASAPAARKLAVERGNVIYVIPASELAGWQKATAALADDWAKDVTAKGHDGKALLHTAKDLVRKYEQR